MLSDRSRDVLIVAGEASGDLHGSNLVRAIRRLDSGITFRGIGGKRMEDAGVKTLISSCDMAVVGLTEVFSRLNTISKAYVKLKNILRSARPDLLILIDYPDFNIRLAHFAKRSKVPVLYYVSPQVWAWRTGRVKKIARRVDRMAVILPFEEDFYRRRGVAVEYVGHPILDSIPQHLDRTEIIRELELSRNGPIVGLLPGSRREEISNLLPSMVGAVEILSERYKDLECVLPVASTISPELIESTIAHSSVKIRPYHGNIYKVLAACNLALVTSGTATLEVGIMGVPMVIVYRVSPVTYWIGKKMIHVPHIGLVNLVAGEEVVPELIQDEITPQRLAEEALAILEGGRKREKMIEELKMVRERLGDGGASERTARIAIEMMAGRSRGLLK